MAPGDYKVQTWIGENYKPLIIRGRPLHEQADRLNFSEKRRNGDQNIDLWLDSSLYPIDPQSGKRPRLDSPASLLEFVGDGENGLLGYIKRVENNSTGSREKEVESSVLRARIDELILQSAKESGRSQVVIAALQNGLFSVQSELRITHRNHKDQLLTTSIEREGLVIQNESLKELNDQRVRELEQTHKESVSGLNARITATSKELRNTKLRLHRLMKTPYGIRSHIRRRRDLSELAPTGGHAKETRRLARTVIAAGTTRRLQEHNAANSTHRRLCGSEEAQEQTGKILGSLLSKKEVDTVVSLPSFNPVGVKLTNCYLSKIGQSMGPRAVLETCDETGITQAGYNAIYEKFKGGLQTAGKGLRVGCLPNPHQVQLLRRELNLNLEELVGVPLFIENTYEASILTKKQKKSGKAQKFLTLDKFNNLFLDIESVQRTMIRLYKITLEEVGDSPLQFVMKMDEAEIVHAEKLERISITLMNRALDPEIAKNDDRYFSVQSEREIWPIGCFRVPKENHEVLNWVFGQTSIPSLISAQSSGQLLHVPDVGSFKVQWHLSADMKTMKSLYGLSAGANSTHCCIYCEQRKVKPVVTTESAARQAAQRRTPTWEGGLFASGVASKPVSLTSSDRWRPVLPIPLERVHICTLHAFNRICEKVLHLHFQYVWTIRDKQTQEAAISDVESILSATGMHGGAVRIFKDMELSGTSNNMPNKPSLSGANAAKLFKKSLLPTGSDRVWRDIVLAERNVGSDGSIRRERMACWSALERLIPYFTGLRLTPEQCSNFKKLADDFGKTYIKVFGENHVTHYIHVFIKHAPWFVETYGSLSVWSCEGMEYSHHAAKSAYHKHTQHGGSKNKKSPLLQTYEHWFRIIQHRFHNQVVQRCRGTDVGIPEEIIQKRREASLNSSAASHACEWRARCTRVGSRWIPNTTSQPDGPDENNQRDGTDVNQQPDVPVNDQPIM